MRVACFPAVFLQAHRGAGDASLLRDAEQFAAQDLGRLAQLFQRFERLGDVGRRDRHGAGHAITSGATATVV